MIKRKAIEEIRKAAYPVRARLLNFRKDIITWMIHSKYS